MEDIIKLLNDFFQSEVEAAAARNVPNIESYNNKLDVMNDYVVESLKNRFGMIPMKELSPDDYYERVKSFPIPNKRYLFKIDKYKTSGGKFIYKCLVSKSNPRRPRLFSLFIVEYIDEKLKIQSFFNFSDKGMGGEKKWYYIGGSEDFMHKFNGEYLLNEEALGEKIETIRLLEPVSVNGDGLKEYHKD